MEVLDPQDIECMKMAIEAARNCRLEKPDAPKVGAVAKLVNGTIVTAFRGEYVPAFNDEQGPGDHAEYTLLEKKLPEATLAGSTIYATLEPCSTARMPPKIPCAIRLRARCVAKVWIGVLDPDKRIQGDGQQLLDDAGIETQLFQLEFRKQIRELNRDFIRSRQARAQQDSAQVRRAQMKLALPLEDWVKTRWPSSVGATRRTYPTWEEFQAGVVYVPAAASEKVLLTRTR
jgi:ATP-dependent DNA helicase RecG